MKIAVLSATQKWMENFVQLMYKPVHLFFLHMKPLF